MKCLLLLIREPQAAASCGLDLTDLHLELECLMVVVEVLVI